MELIDTVVSLGLQVSSLLAVATYIWALKHPRVRRHRFRRFILAAATIFLAAFITATFFVWGTFVNARHPTLINGRPVEGR